MASNRRIKESSVAAFGIVDLTMKKLSTLFLDRNNFRKERVCVPRDCPALQDVRVHILVCPLRTNAVRMRWGRNTRLRISLGSP